MQTYSLITYISATQAIRANIGFANLCIPVYRFSRLSPLHTSVLLFIPQLPCVHHILPNHVCSRSHGREGIEKRDSEPYRHHSIFLAERLTCTDIVAVWPSYSLAEREKHKSDHKRQGKKTHEHDTCHRRIENVVHRKSGDYSQIKAPHIETEVSRAADAFVETGQKFTGEHGKHQRCHKHRGHIAQYKQRRGHERYVRLFLDKREKNGDDER